MLFGGITLPGAPDPQNIARLDVLPIPQIRRMMRVGVAIDREHLWQLSSQLESKKAALKNVISTYIPPESLDQFVGESSDELDLNVDSAEQIAHLLYKLLGVGRGQRLKLTKSGKRLSTGKKQLEGLKRDHEVISLILEYRECSKLKSTYTDKLPLIARMHPAGTDCPLCGLRHTESSWRVHTSILTTRTATGRLSCAAAWTPIRTTRGIVPISDILIGDQVWTHKFRWRRVRDKWVSGLEEMYDVRLSNGHTLTCTGYHKVLEYTHECIEDLGEKPKKCQASPGSLPLSGIANTDGNCDSPWNHLSQHPSCVQTALTCCGVQGTDEDSILQIQVWDQEPNVWEDRGPAPQLDRASGRWVRVLDLYQRRQASICASDSNGGSSRTGGDSRTSGSSPYRWKSQKQQSGQPGSHNIEGTSTITLLTGEGLGFCDVEEIYPVGSLAVFDIQVEEDESYQACGVFSHNSKSPNLQNIPTRTKAGQDVRRGFVASKGKLLISADYSQIELRLLAHAANERNMMKVFEDGGDIHLATAMRAFNIEDPKKVDKILHRAPCKNVNFGVAYGLGPPGLYDLMAVTYATAGQDLPDWLDQEWCAGFIRLWFELYPEAQEYFELQHYRAKRYGIVWTMFGRVRRVPEVQSVHERIRVAGLRQAGNMPIQGDSADVMKIGMARVERRLEGLRGQGIYVEAMLPIHDELLVETDEEWAEEIAEIVKYEMEQALVDDKGVLQCRVPIKSDSRVMKVWEKE